MFFTHDNGGRPFAVNIVGKKVEIYRQNKEEDFDEKVQENIPYTKILEYDTDEIFIGKDETYPGNSILIRVKDKYIYIGEKIFSFETESPIIKYHSPVGNSDVPYPYAIDEEGFNYLMIESVILKAEGDPYDYLYENNHLINKFQDISFEGYTDYYLFDAERKEYERCSLNFHPNPQKRYNNLWEDGYRMYVKKNGRMEEMSEEEFVRINKKFGRERGIRIIEKRIIHKKLY